MAELSANNIITKPGVVAIGSGHPAGPSLSSVNNKKVFQVACGWEHSAVVCESGLVYSFGRNLPHCVLNEKTVDGVIGPTIMPTLSTIKINQAACGDKFTFFLSDEGELFAWGDNNYGQLGLGHKIKSHEPVLVTGLPYVQKVSAAYRHAVALTVGGEVWVSGFNGNGQLGLDNCRSQCSFTQVHNVSEAISDISCGADHTAILSISQVLLLSGYNDYGQLGLGNKISTNHFLPVSLPSPVAAIACGYNHTVALTVSGTVWAWGWNSCGELGTGAKTNRYSPTKMVGLENYKITNVFAGCRHSAVLTEEGDVLVCGRGRDGELGQGKEDRLVPSLLQKSPGLFVQQLAFAWTYTLLLVASTQNNEPTSPKHDVQVTGCGTDMERDIMKSLECPVCLRIMCAPIHLCVSGHSLCASCRSGTVNCSLCLQPYTETRNINLECLSTILHLPCVNCLVRMPAALLEKHAEVCPDRRYSCPIQRSCGWSGRPETMLAHTSSTHPDQTWRDLPHLFAHSTSDELMCTGVLAAHNEVFTLHRRYNKTERQFQVAVRYIGEPKNKHKFSFEFAFILDDNHVTTFRRNICADTENFDDMFQSANCVSLEQKQLDTYLQQDKLVCEVSVLTAGQGDRTGHVKALLCVI